MSSKGAVTSTAMLCCLLETSRDGPACLHTPSSPSFSVSDLVSPSGAVLFPLPFLLLYLLKDRENQLEYSKKLNKTLSNLSSGQHPCPWQGLELDRF